MSHKSYSIRRWDAVLFGNSEYPTPIIYIEADPSLLEFAKYNNDVLLVSIKSTNSIYDDKQISGIFASSAEIPNCREIFFKKTKLYVIVLNAGWYGYPDYLGECDIYGLKGVIIPKEINNTELHKPQTIENYTDNENRSGYGLQSAHLVAVSVGILIILLVVLFLIKK